MLEIRVLNGLALDVNGRSVELPADARARELLGWLVVAPGPHARSTLAGRLRPDVAEESARKTLRDAVYELRRVLGPDGREAIVATRDQVGLDPELVRADLWDFHRRIAEGDLQAAAADGTGELLAGIDADWVLRARDEHAAEVAHVLAALAGQTEAAGELDAAIRWTRRRLEVEPLAEKEAHRDLIRRLARAGDRPAALTAATALNERLRRALGVPPSADTRALVEEVRRGGLEMGAPGRRPAVPAGGADADRHAGGSAPHARPARPGVARGPGRRPALRRDGRRAGDRQDHRGGGGGPPRPRRRRRRPLRALRRARARPLPALGGGAGGAARRAADRRRGALAERPRRCPRAAAARPRRRGAPEHGAPARYLAFESVRALLEHTAGVRPVLLVLDDLHWIDGDSAALLRHLTGSPVRARLLVVVTARAHELTPSAVATLAELRRAGPLVHEVLTGLDDEAVAAPAGQPWR